jgi:hypothetical protein
MESPDAIARRLTHDPAARHEETRAALRGQWSPRAACVLACCSRAMSSVSGVGPLADVLEARRYIESECEPDVVARLRDEWDPCDAVRHLIACGHASLLEACCLLPSTRACERACEMAVSHFMEKPHLGGDAAIRWMYRVRALCSTHRELARRLEESICSYARRVSISDDRVWILASLVEWATGTEHKRRRLECADASAHEGFARACVRLACHAALLCQRGLADEDAAADTEMGLRAQDVDILASEEEADALSVRWAALRALEEAGALGCVSVALVRHVVDQLPASPADRVCIARRVGDAARVESHAAGRAAHAREQCLWVEAASRLGVCAAEVRARVHSLLRDAQVDTFCARLLLRAAQRLDMVDLPWDRLLSSHTLSARTVSDACAIIMPRADAATALCAISRHIAPLGDDAKWQALFHEYRARAPAAAAEAAAAAADAGAVPALYGYAMYFDLCRADCTPADERTVGRYGACLRACAPPRSSLQAWALALCAWAMLRCAPVPIPDHHAQLVAQAVREMDMCARCPRIRAFCTYALLLLRPDARMADADDRADTLSSTCSMLNANPALRARALQFHRRGGVSRCALEIAADDSGPFSRMSSSLRIPLPALS